jgi:hypothetical protein
LRVRPQKIATNDKLSGGRGNLIQPVWFSLVVNLQGFGNLEGLFAKLQSRLDCHTQNIGTSSEILGSQ